MSWITRLPPKIRKFLGKKNDIPSDLWIKDPTTGELEFHRDVENNQFVMPRSGHHMLMTAAKRLKWLFGSGVWESIPTPEFPLDPLHFRPKGKGRYTDRLEVARNETGGRCAIMLGHGKLDGLPIVTAIHDFPFIGGTLAREEGEAVIIAFRTAIEKRTPLIIFTASGGARMQEGIFSLMQMPRITLAVQDAREAGLPYIVVFTNSTYGGVTGSYAMLGDVLIAEPGAMIGFAGQELTTQVTGEKNFPEGYQSAKFQLERGAIDMIVHRHKLRETLARLCRLLMRLPTSVAVPQPI